MKLYRLTWPGGHADVIVTRIRDKFVIEVENLSAIPTEAIEALLTKLDGKPTKIGGVAVARVQP